MLFDRFVMAGSDHVLYGPEQKRWIETVSSIARTEMGKLLVTPPTFDPLALYDFGEQESVTSALYQVPSTALNEKQRSDAISETALTNKIAVSNTIGFQCNFRDLSHAACAHSFLSTHVNNGGSPFEPSSDRLATTWMERNVLDYYASLWHAKWPHNPRDPDSYWGYTLTMGSTEGNLLAVWNARNYLSGKYMNSSGERSKCALSNYMYEQCMCPDDNSNALSPVAFFSHETHYSIMKTLEAMTVPSFYEMGRQKYPNQCPLDGDWPLAVPCEGGDAGPGTIDVKALTTLVDFFSSNGHPIIVIFNYGTTFKGAYDDVKSAGDALVPILKKNNTYKRKLYHADGKTYISRKGFWFHVDGALGAAYAPFLQMAYENGLTKHTPPPVFDFQLDFVSSIVTSGHKWIGSPWPCGIYISKTEYQLRSCESAQITYIDSPDLTLSGSRNAHSALVLWSYISTHSYDEQAKLVVTALEIAAYAVQKLKEVEIDIKHCLGIIHSPASLAICFIRPHNEEILKKYTLFGHWLHIDGRWQQYVHIYITNGVTTSKIDELVKDLKMPSAFK